MLAKAIVTLPTPTDLRLVAQRFVDHAIEPRLSPTDVSAIVQDLGYPDLESFCRDVGLPDHITERWKRFGVSSEMGQIFAFLGLQRSRVRDAVDEFEATRNVGLDEFFCERGLI
ncbi:hypothetical protein [Microvirga alba]|uniref:Uncharacterized protein n=1 Tax=Microvirga alba TaxID=2791025 RepID=A0A931FQL5_9HYPH|nr:hypothetical protein [Microvirga alba]MBF9231906.1 hypothetical protein [Microvirga alba]